MTEKNEKLQIGVCGIGSIGFRHARLLSQRPDVSLFLCDPVQAHLDSAKHLPNLVRITQSFDDLIDSNLDGLIIASPDKFHIPQAEAACRKGIAVLIEKPVAETAKQGESLLKTIIETQAKVLVGYPLRHNSVFLKAKELIDENIIGEPVSFHIMLGAYNTLIAAKNRFSETDKNKLFVDYSHEWDYLNWFLGKAKRVTAISHQSGNREKKQNPNIVNAVIELESGISGTAHLDYIQSPGQRCFTIIGDKGTIAIDGVKSRIILQVYEEDYERIFQFAETFDGMMTQQIKHFIEVIQSNQKLAVTLNDGLSALRLADALILSCKNGSWQTL